MTYTMTYTGEWKDGERHGQGTLTHPDGHTYTGKVTGKVAMRLLAEDKLDPRKEGAQVANRRLLTTPNLNKPAP